MKTTIKKYLNLDVVNIHDKDKIVLMYNKLIEEQLIMEAEKGYPLEIAGFMLGIRGSKDEVVSIFPAENMAKQQERRFEISANDYMKIEAYALRNQLDVIGIYHSHPDYPAIPSIHDLKYAQEVFSYVIVSMDAAGLSMINSWKKENEKFIQQNIEIQ